MNSKTTRRKFLLGSAAVTGGIVGMQQIKQSVSSTPGTMPERVLGNTGVSLPILGLGGAGKTPLSQANQEAKAAKIIERALTLGIRYYDTAASYGPSEGYLGQVLPPYRNDIFLVSKTAARDRDGAWRELERSLQRLNTDYLDAWQLHHVSTAADIEQIFADTGAIKAVEEAKSQGLIRFSGITGHHEPDIIAQSLKRYPFDTTLVSLNAADVHHPRPFQSMLPTAQSNNVGVVAMKVPAYGRLLQRGMIDMTQAMGYTLSLPGVHCCIIAAENPQQLESNVNVAVAFQPLSDVVKQQIEQQTVAAGEDGSFFRRWT